MLWLFYYGLEAAYGVCFICFSWDQPARNNARKDVYSFQDVRLIVHAWFMMAADEHILVTFISLIVLRWMRLYAYPVMPIENKRYTTELLTSMD